MVNIPVINIDALFPGGNPEARLQTAQQIGNAARDVGFFVITGHRVEDSVIDNAWTSTRQFFDLSEEEKLQFTKPQHVYPFGYQGFGSEVLSAGKAIESKDNASTIAPPDLKEMFSLGPSDPATKFPPREFPTVPAAFEASWTLYYDTIFQLATVILQAFALSMELDERFFEKFMDHHASALRAINYPAIEVDATVQAGQLRASAHTDYGTITILKSDGPGLQVSKDQSPPTWYNVPHVQGAFIINLGDLMRRWTNDEWLSTLHRVVIPDSELAASGAQDAASGLLTEEAQSDRIEERVRTTMTRRRQSMAFFHNINRDAVVECLLLKEGDVAKHAPIVAGEFLMQKHLASTKK